VITASAIQPKAHDDFRMWIIALGLSLLINLLLVFALVFWVIRALSVTAMDAPQSSAEKENVATIVPDWTPTPDPAVEDPAKRFARTAADQETAEAPKTSAFEGERNTQATSDRAPVVDAPELPSQQGIDPRDPNEFETTESQYRDGRLDEPDAPDSPPSEPAPPTPIPAPEPQQAAAAASTPPAEIPPLKETAYDGPNPVDVAAQPDETPPPDPVRQEQPPQETPPDPRPDPQEQKAPKQEEAPKEPAQPATRANDPAFSGFQQKTAIVGSISRTGTSALDVEDTPLGRYQAAISRAVELEWQRNCVRHRDFITPGFLTVRFFVEPSGKVRSVQFVGDMETGEVQKGFTLNSIRDAPIPKMPDAVKSYQQGEPLELVFRFYF